MMTELLLHQSTKDNVSRFIAKPSHALIITGFEGSGKLLLAKYLAVQILGLNTHQDLEKQQFMLIVPIKDTISIDKIRSASQFMKLKTIGERPIKRVLIVVDAELMTLEAQNAFLKLLEEPPADTIIILTSSNVKSLLPTILSRAQQLKVESPNELEIFKYFKKLDYSEAQIEKAYHLCEGRIGKMYAFLSGDESQEFLDKIEQVKNILSLNQYNRLLKINVLAKDKQQVKDFLNALITVNRAGLKTAINKDDIARVRQWHQSLKSSLEAQKNLQSNVNLKLLLTDLMLSL